MSRNGIIYLVTCPEGKSYVGKTLQKLSDRVSQHKKKHAATRAIRDAFQRHGDFMKVSVLMRCTEEDLDMNESLYIEVLDTLHPRGYNLRCGAMAARPTMDQAISNHVHQPVQYDSEDDCRGVATAVAEDVQHISRVTCDDECKPWAGVVQKSVKEVNYIRGAKQFKGWCGSRKKMVKRDEVESSKRTRRLSVDVAESLAREGRAGHQSRMDDIDYNEKVQIAGARFGAEQLKLVEQNMKLLKQKMEIAKEVGMHDKAAAIKRKLSELLDI